LQCVIAREWRAIQLRKEESVVMAIGNQRGASFEANQSIVQWLV